MRNIDFAMDENERETNENVAINENVEQINFSMEENVGEIDFVMEENVAQPDLVIYEDVNNVGSANSEDDVFEMPMAYDKVPSIPDIQKPYVGQEFDSHEDAYQFYLVYARALGFGVRKNSTKKWSKNGDIMWRQFVCEKQGFKKIREGVNQKIWESRIGCEAKLNVSLRSGRWVITKFVEQHCHDLTTPTKAHMHRSDKKFHKNDVARELMSQINEYGIGPSKKAKVINKTGGNNVMIRPQQVIDELRTQRVNNLGQEACAVAKHFQEMKVRDPDFFFSIEIGSDYTLRSMFWADSRARDSYMNFGDVIVFDAVYTTNKFQLPFSSFTGVNHHMQSALFGCALLADETEDTYVWVFEQWLKCMFGKAPTVILTDMDPSMKKAIARVFPQTKHMFCSWHINRHAHEHLALLRVPQSDFGEYYYQMINSSTMAKLEERWESLKQKFKIEEGSWLCRMWNEREHWMKAYWGDIFTAGMTATSRSESMNAFFDGFLNEKTSLTTFIRQYEKALESQRRAEDEEDFKTLNTKPIMLTTRTFEQQVGEWYTRRVFALFQEELKQCLSLRHEKVIKLDDLATYLVGLTSDYIEKNKKWHKVDYRVVDNRENLSCSCRKFETEGLLCCHIIYIICKKNISFIPIQYMLKRWSIYSRFTNFNDSKDQEPIEVNASMIWGLTAKFSRLVRDHPLPFRTYKEIQGIINSVETLVKSDCDVIAKTNGQDIVAMGECVDSVNIGEHIIIQDPIIARPRGSSRLKSGIELSKIEKQKKRTKRSSYGQEGHYTNTCASQAKDGAMEE